MKAGGGRGGGVGGEMRNSGRGERKRAESWRDEERASVGGVGKTRAQKCKKKKKKNGERKSESGAAFGGAKRVSERRKRDVFCVRPG